MLIELKRIKNNHLGLYIVVISILSGILGLVLMLTLDKMSFSEVTLGEIQYSIYTVYTQFGFFFFPVLAIYHINNDYRDKNIIFYKMIKVNVFSYILFKICTLMLFMMIGIMIVAIGIGVIYGDLSNAFLFFIKLGNVSSFIVIVAVLYAYLCKSMILAYCINFAMWIMGAILHSINDIFRFTIFYDGSLERHRQFQEVLKNGHIIDRTVFDELLYNLIVILVVVAIVGIFKKRWEKNGI